MMDTHELRARALDHATALYGALFGAGLGKIHTTAEAATTEFLDSAKRIAEWLQGKDEPDRTTLAGRAPE